MPHLSLAIQKLRYLIVEVGQMRCEKNARSLQMDLVVVAGVDRRDLVVRKLLLQVGFVVGAVQRVMVRGDCHSVAASAGRQRAMAVGTPQLLQVRRKVLVLVGRLVFQKRRRFGAAVVDFVE